MLSRIFLACVISLSSALISPLFAAEVSVIALFKDKAAVMIDGKQSVLVVGQGHPSGVRLLSADSEQAVLEVDGRRVIRYLEPQYGLQQPATRSVMTVKIAADEQGMYRVKGKLNNKRVEFLVDTGASMVAVSRQMADTLKLDYDTSQVAVATTAGGEVNAYSMVLKKVQIGRLVQRDVEAVVLEGEYPPQPLLGMSFLKKVTLTRRDQQLLLTVE